MKSAIVLFPGINRERDMYMAIHAVTGVRPLLVWHEDSKLPKVDLVVIPGGFSFGDYLRCGAIAARSPIMADLCSRAKAGMRVLGVCNGFQILTESGLLPGALVRNRTCRFVCRSVKLKVENNRTFFTAKAALGAVLRCPVAHGEGNFVAEPAMVRNLEESGRIVFRYVDGTNPNGATNNIAGIMNERGNVIGMMPHPENMIEPIHGATDCRVLFEGLMEAA